MPNPISIQVMDASGINQTVSTLDAVLASTLQVGGSVTVTNFPATQPVSGPLTDSQMRANPVSITRPALAYTNRSGIIAAGGTAQVIMPANGTRLGWRIQNLSSADLWVNDKGATATASQPSFKLAAGASYESPAFGASAAAISIFGATTGQSFEAMEA